MNTIPLFVKPGRLLIVVAAAAALLAGCAAAPVKPEGAAQARSKLTQLQADPDLASRAPIAIEEADRAVRIAETPQPDVALTMHRIYMAERKVDIARALAETRFAEDQRGALSQQRDNARLDARTREADAAKKQAAMAMAENARQKAVMDQARDAADAARLAAASSEAKSAQMQREIAALQAKVTDRGLVLTLGDVLFASGKAALQSGASGNLNKLVAFLNKYPERSVAIEGYTDSVGSEEYNQALSQRRAEAVRSYLVGQGIGPQRLIASGMGESSPIAPNDSAAGRQQNRRVEMIIENPMTASSQ